MMIHIFRILLIIILFLSVTVGITRVLPASFLVPQHDATELYATIIQTSGTFMAIIAGFLTSKFLSMSVEQKPTKFDSYTIILAYVHLLPIFVLGLVMPLTLLTFDVVRVSLSLMMFVGFGFLVGVIYTLVFITRYGSIINKLGHRK